MQKDSKNGDIAHVVESYFTVLSFKGQTLEKKVLKGKDSIDVERTFRKKYPKRLHVEVTPL